MKRIVFVLALLMVSIIASAQRWTTQQTEADELLGTSAGTQFSYSDDVGIFSYTDDTNFSITTKQGIFLVRIGSASVYTPIIVGFYDADNHLVKSWKNGYALRVEGDKPKTAYGDWLFKKYRREIIEYLNNNTGYIRFVITRNGDPDFDFKVPCRMEIQ